MAELDLALVDLERALRRAGHPLADPALRPAGRRAGETRRAGRELLSIELPEDLVTLWSWWGTDTWPNAARTLRPFATELPGGLRVASLERAIELYARSSNAKVVPPERENALPVILGGDNKVEFWCSTATSGRVPIQVVDIWDPFDPITELDSIATLISDMTRLLDERLWIDTPSNSWQYVGEYGIFSWI